MGLLELFFKKEPEIKETRTVSYHRKFSLHGIRYESIKNPNYNRQEILTGLRKNDAVHLEKYIYNGEPAYMVVVDKRELDIGVVPAQIVPRIEKYANNDYSLKILKKFWIDESKNDDDENKQRKRNNNDDEFIACVELYLEIYKD